MAETPRYRTTFVRLLGFLKPYRWSLVVSIVLAVLSQSGQFASATENREPVARAVDAIRAELAAISARPRPA